MKDGDLPSTDSQVYLMCDSIMLTSFNNLTDLRVDSAVDVVSETYRLLFMFRFEQ
jgi:hypothetical protein